MSKHTPDTEGPGLRDALESMVNFYGDAADQIESWKVFERLRQILDTHRPDALRDVRHGFVHGATWAGRSLKSARKAALNRYPERAAIAQAGEADDMREGHDRFCSCDACRDRREEA